MHLLINRLTPSIPLLLLVALASPAGTLQALPGPADTFELVFADEFDGDSLDLEKWAFRTDVKHRSAQLKENVRINGGRLKLRLREHQRPVEGKRASGAGIVTRERFRYGYYEVRARLGDGRDDDRDGRVDEGWHHAFWAMAARVEGDTVGTTYPEERRTEIDCYENASDHKHAAESGLNRFTQHVIVWKENGKEWGRLPKPPGDITAIEGFDAGEWHTYGFEWDPARVTFYVDGAVTQVAEYPAETFEHDWINVWLTAISANWNVAGAEDSRAEYDYFRFYKRR